MKTFASRSSIKVIELVVSAFSNTTGIKVAEIPAGLFDMGSPASEAKRLSDWIAAPCAFPRTEDGLEWNLARPN